MWAFLICGCNVCVLCSVKKSEDYVREVRSKEELVFHMGFRQFSARLVPLVSFGHEKVVWCGDVNYSLSTGNLEQATFLYGFFECGQTQVREVFETRTVPGGDCVCPHCFWTFTRSRPQGCW